MHLGVDPRPLRQAGDDGPQTAVPEAEHRQRCVLDLDEGMVEVGPVAGDLLDLAHEPAQQVELVWRLVDQHASALGRPLAAPGVGLVVGPVAPAEHREDTQHRRPDLAGVDCRLHAPDRLVEAALTDDAQPRPRPARRGKHGVTVSEAGGQRLLDQGVYSRLGGRDYRGGMQWMGSADEHRLGPRVFEHLAEIGVGAGPVPLAEG
jgi:hypothetical protein